MVLKYVDDGVSIDKLNFETATRVGTRGRLKHAVKSQNLFRHVVGEAKKKGMVVNTGKTQLLLIDDSMSYDAEAYIEDEEGNELTSGDSMKMLGFYFSRKPNVDAHVDALRRRFRQKYWVLLHLRKFGFNEDELSRVYKTIVRPVADYCSVIYHSMLTDQQDKELDICQAHALRCIFGMGVSYSEMRRRAGVTTLRQRRVEQCDKFAESCAKSSRFAHWFPLKEGRRSSRVGSEKYLEKFARCNRLKNSPLYYMRRRLNGKEGKVYGERNKDRRRDDYHGGASSVAWMRD